MDDFNASLVREIITFNDDAEEHAGAGPTIIRSNRMFLKLTSGTTTEKVVVRAQNMHTALRIASRIMYSYYKNGLFLKRIDPFEWDVMWDAVLSTYEKDFNPNIWAAVYINGQPVFKTTTTPFVDVIEKCALLTIDNYDATMGVTEDALKQLGRAVRISHSSNVATVFTDNAPTMRGGIIDRSGGNDATFNFMASGGELHNRVSQSINAAGSYLEALNLRYFVKAMRMKLRKGEITRSSPEAIRMRAASARLGLIKKTVDSFEETFEVKYRPEKPDFFSNVM